LTFKEKFLLNFLEKRVDQSWYLQHLQTMRGRFEFEILKKVILNYLPPEDSLILDVGIDPGIFSKIIAEKKRRIIIADISVEQLQITRKRLEKENLSNFFEQFAVLESFTDLRQFDNETFDLIISLYGTLSYTCDERKNMLAELARVCKPGAPIILSVKNKINYIRSTILKADLEKLLDPLKAGLWEFLDTSYKPFEDFPAEPSYYAFSSDEIMKLLEKCGCELLEIRALNCLFPYMSEELVNLFENKDILKTLLTLEERLSTNPGLLDTGSELLVVARKAFL